MKIINDKAYKEPPGGKDHKNKILVELDEDDVLLLGEIIRSFEQSDMYDKDDNKVVEKLKHNKEQMHKAFTIVRPS